MNGDARMFNSINTNGNDGYDSITFGDNGKGKIKGLGKIAISNDMSVTTSVLHHKSFTKTCHKHHVYVLMHVTSCVDQFL